MTDILPADEERELNFKRSNYWPVKFLLPDGSVVDKLPVDASVQVEAGDTKITESVIPGFNIPEFNRIQVTYPDTVTEIYIYKKDLETVATVTVIYTSATKEYLLSVVKS